MMEREWVRERCIEQAMIGMDGGGPGARYLIERAKIFADWVGESAKHWEALKLAVAAYPLSPAREVLSRAEAIMAFIKGDGE